ncbi:hypothetical protein SHKM778_17930 [Streptomyces sp. KM77-8]|uniref:Uncharacterized protein n=1 Tax=Streptomyces haneummycinicus TaxID=3074435 RepID=A0AAT9HDE5_9ACTN
MTHQRTFSISQVSETAGEGVLDIPSLSVLRYKDPETLLSDFESLWGVRASTVALPVLEPDGLLFEVKGLRGLPPRTTPLRPRASRASPTW